MRKVLTFLGIGLSMMASAQQRPHYTQYILNNYIINPAVAGIESYTDVKISHRHQWVGLQDAPVTTYATIHGSIGKDDSRTTTSTFEPSGSNPRGRAYWEEYQSADPHHGWGVQVINDQTGPLKRFSAYGTYAYHMGLSPKLSMSMGASIGFTNNTLNTSKLIFDNPLDPVVANSDQVNKMQPDINIGVWLYGSNFFGGVSAMQVIPQGLSFVDGQLGIKKKAFPHIFATAGYRFNAGEDFNVIPSVVVRYVDPLPVGVDLNAKLQYRDLLWVGGGYRIGDGITGMVGVNINSTINIGYSYDYTTSRLQNYTKGTHEFVIGFLLGNKWGDTCPRNLW